MRTVAAISIAVSFVTASSAWGHDLSLAASRTRHQQAYGSGCGVECWSVKTGTDSDARLPHT